MIYELRTYTFHPGKLAEYLKLNAEVGRKIRGNAYGTFEASRSRRRCWRGRTR